MKAKITHQKAAWPKGAAVGDIVEIPGESIPDSLLGKCVPVGDDEQVAHTYTPPAPPEPRDPGSKLVPLHTMPAAADSEDLAVAKALLAEAEAEADELRGRLERTLAELEQAKADLAAALERATKAEEAAAAKSTRGGSK